LRRPRVAAAIHREVESGDSPGTERSSVQPPVSLVVPLFNEEDRLAESGAALLEFVAAAGPGGELLLVDDGSDDRTLDAARALAARDPQRVRVLARPHRGKGATVQAGLEAATAPLVAFCDVDLATPLGELRRIIDLAAGTPVLAIGSRDVVSTLLVVREGEVRELMGKAFNVLLRVTLTPGIFDTQCGAKAATAAVWREILPYCHENGFAWDAEVVAISRRRGIAVWEVGVEWHHDSRSRVRPVRDGAAMVRSVPRILRHLRRVPSMVQGPSARPIDLREMVQPVPVGAR
jgi:dolichyl-phosphate beta-glucosyltransferase